MRYLLIIILLLFSSSIFSQEEIKGEESKYENNSLINRDSTLDVVSMYKKKEIFQDKKKKIKRNVFYGFKTKRGFTRRGSGNRIIVELFFVLKKYVEPDKSVAETFWFDLRTKKITSKPITEKHKPFALILHGPYKKYIGKQLVEEGQFYVGTKHGRWMIHDKNNILIDKIKYYKGWPKDSKIEYWDPETKQKIREVIPIVNGIEHGRYVKFYQSGLPEVEGVFSHGTKVGIWLDFYDSKGQKKTEYKYTADSINPEILKRWSPKGKVVFSKYPDPKKNGKSTNLRHGRNEESPEDLEDDEIFEEMENEEEGIEIDNTDKKEIPKSTEKIVPKNEPKK